MKQIHEQQLSELEQVLRLLASKRIFVVNGVIAFEANVVGPFGQLGRDLAQISRFVDAGDQFAFRFRGNVLEPNINAFPEHGASRIGPWLQVLGRLKEIDLYIVWEMLWSFRLCGRRVKGTQGYVAKVG